MFGKRKMNIELLTGTCKEIGEVEDSLKQRGHITEKDVKDFVRDKKLRNYLYPEQDKYPSAMSSKLYEMTLDVGKIRFTSKFFRIQFVYDERADKGIIITNSQGYKELKTKTPQEFFNLLKPVRIDGKELPKVEVKPVEQTS